MRTFFKLMIVLCIGIIPLLGSGLFMQPVLAKPAAVSQRVFPVTYDPPAAVSWNNPKKTIVFIASEGEIAYRVLDGTTLAWGGWNTMGRPPYDTGYFNGVEAVAWANGRVDVIGLDRDIIWHRVVVNSAYGAQIVGDWEEIGRDNRFYNGIQAVSWGANRLDLFIKKMGAGDLYGYHSDPFRHKWWDGSAWGPSGLEWESLGDVYGEINVASWGANRLDVFRRDHVDVIQHMAWDGSGWSGWDSMNGTGSSAPLALSWGANRLDVFMRGGTSSNPSASLYTKSWNGSSWSAWKNLGGSAPRVPVSGVSWGSNRLDIFEVRTTGVFHKALSNSTWLPSTTGWEYIGGEEALKEIVVTSWGPNRLDLFATRSNDGSLWHLAWNGSSWTPSINGWELINP